MMRWGSENVPVLRREWHSSPRTPYRKTYALKPGQSWLDAETTDQQWESYAIDNDGSLVPIGALIARELKAEGASFAAFTEIWHGFVIVDETLTCVEPLGSVQELLVSIKLANNGKLSGFPDVFALFPDGRLAFREAKNRSNKDRLNANQHRMADLIRQLYRDRCDLAVVEWDI